MMVLLVEDNPGDARLLREMFREETSFSATVAHVESMSAVEKYVAAHAVDIILLDLGLPDAQGLEALRRAQAAAPLVPLLVLTGLNDELLAVQALQEGAQDYLIKGQFETHGLLRAMRYAVARNVMEVKMNEDVTELKRLGRQLGQAREVADQANQAKSRFLAGITHELRTPLHGILGYAELLSLEGGLNPTQMQRLDAMMAAGQYLLLTINAVLDMSQIESDRLELRPIDIQLPDLVRTCLDVVRPAAEAKGLSLVLAPAALFRLFVDPMRLQQVLINLLGNAVKFTPSGAVEVRLRQAEIGECVRLEVVDTGPGIRPVHRDKLFQTFERLNAETVSGIEGAGLGLAIAARLVQMMGGRIGYVDNPGGGSVFWLELPRATVPAAEAEPVPMSRLAESSRLRVLVVDDEVLNRNIAGGFLSIAGHEVVCVDNGAAAVEAAAADDFDVILMDVRMPGMNGLQATRLIRALPPPRGQVRVVAVTAQAFAQQIEICRQAGMDGHVSKPFKQAVLLAALENATALPTNTEWAATPAAAGHADAEVGLPVLDRAVFEEITETLSAADLQENLQILLTRCEALLRGLRMSGMLSQASELAEAAHKLAGGAGTFGFLQVAAAARRFEAAADLGAPETTARADDLAAAIEASVMTVRQERLAMDAVAR
jgi:signal transduction histidine kinase/HPt (histidine-containing phosphotransfer) domain-containing protein